MTKNKENSNERPKPPIKPEGPALQPMNDSKKPFKDRKPKNS